MTRYIAQRLLAGLLTAFLVSLILFTFLRVIPSVAPGWTHREYYPPPIILCWDDCELNREFMEEIRRELGLDPPPLHTQYLHWVGSWVTGYWGESRFSPENFERPWVTSWSYGKSTFETLQLVATAQAIVVLAGIPAGIIMALKRNSWIDTLGLAISRMWLGLPIFWTSTLLLVGGVYFVGVEAQRVGYIPLIG